MTLASIFGKNRKWQQKARKITNERDWEKWRLWVVRSIQHSWYLCTVDIHTPVTISGTNCIEILAPTRNQAAGKYLSWDPHPQVAHLNQSTCQPPSVFLYENRDVSKAQFLYKYFNHLKFHWWKITTWYPQASSYPHCNSICLKKSPQRVLASSSWLPLKVTKKASYNRYK